MGNILGSRVQDIIFSWWLRKRKLADAGRREGSHEKFQLGAGSRSSGGHSDCTAAIWGLVPREGANFQGPDSDGKGWAKSRRLTDKVSSPPWRVPFPEKLHGKQEARAVVWKGMYLGRHPMLTYARTSVRAMDLSHETSPSLPLPGAVNPILCLNFKTKLSLQVPNQLSEYPLRYSSPGSGNNALKTLAAVSATLIVL